MSFFRDVINCVNENETVEARKNIKRLLAEIQNFQFKTKQYIEETYTEFLSNSTTNNDLFLREAIKLSEEIDLIMENVENETKIDLLQCTSDIQQYIEQLQENTIELRTTEKLLRINDLFKKLEDAKNQRVHFQMNEYLMEIKSIMDDPKDEIIRNLECYQSIKIKWFMEHELMLHNLKQKFESLVQFNEKKFQNTKSITIRISKNENELYEIIIALINSKYNPNRMCEFLLTNVFIPIITKPVSIECNAPEMNAATAATTSNNKKCVGDDTMATDDQRAADDVNNDFHQLSLSYGLNDLANDILQPNYKIIFEHIKTVFNCLGHMNISINDELCVFNIFAKHFKDTFLSKLINECLSYSIPGTMDEMNTSSIVADILELNEFLVNMLFLNGDDKELINYAEKIGILFKNRFCMNILDSAIEIMHKDIHDMMIVGDLKSDSNDPSLFPRCMISKSTLELINLIEKVIKQTETTSELRPELNESLLSTIPTILSRYIVEVPNYHEKLLLNIPQQTALYHNNCMYLAYFITSIKNNITDDNLILTLIKQIQQSGSEQFVIQIKNQHSQIMDILEHFDLTDATTEIGNESKKIIRQCLRQLDLLKNVWQTVLPEMVYNKTMGNILNDFCTKLIQRIITLEDISSTVANDLVQIFDNVIDRAPNILKDPLQITIIVKSWVKFQQMKMILNTSLVQITELWSEGKGPLSLHYKADEIKHLIRAIFQNTDRRAAALLTIV